MGGYCSTYFVIVAHKNIFISKPEGRYYFVGEGLICLVIANGRRLRLQTGLHLA
jgi:hypothetical protein